jgi:hypothetical protein
MKHLVWGELMNTGNRRESSGKFQVEESIVNPTCKSGTSNAEVNLRVIHV